MPLSATPLAEAPLADLLARLAGAVGGAAISVAYVLPRGRREAGLRFFTGVTAGVIFGPAARSFSSLIPCMRPFTVR